MEKLEVIKNKLIDKFDAEDTIFNNCMNDFSQFPSYITSYTDIKERFSTRHMSPAFKNLNVDSVFLRQNSHLVNIEHHSTLRGDLMRRDYNYITTLAEASARQVDPFIFNTGPLPKSPVEYINDTMFYNPTFFNTQSIEGTVNLNNLRYKVNNKEELSQKDALDLIWLIKTNINIDKEVLLHELTVKIWAKAVAPRWMLEAIRKNLILWGKKHLRNVEIIKEFKEVLKMSKIEIKPFEEQIRIAGIAGELERAEEKGRKIGNEITEEKFITKLLKNHTPEQISKEYEIPLQRVQEIKNSKLPKFH